MTDTPFIYGKLAESVDFTDRERETQRLIQNFEAYTNTVLISPRRWGKSSLVHKAGHTIAKRNKAMRIVFIDLFNVRTEEEFYRLLAEQVLRASAGKMEELMDNAKRFLQRVTPKLTYSPEPNSEFSLGLDWKEVKKYPDEILNLCERIAVSRKLSFVICIDEFQNISTFDQPLAIQKKLRAHWQKHKRTAYCLYGSKRHMMLDVFTSPSMPFYKFGDLMTLEKISEADWINFIVKRFADTNKRIKPEVAALVPQLTERHSYYVQQLAQLSWLRSGKICTAHDVRNAHDSLVMQLSLLFQTITDDLTVTQINFLKAVLEGVVQLSAAETLQTYSLGTSANVLRIKQSLLNKEVLDIQGDRIDFLDPVYKHWLKTHYFKIPYTD